MKYMHKIFHMKDPQEAGAIHELRMKGEATTKLAFKIKPYGFPDDFRAYYVPTNETMMKIGTVYSQDDRLNRLNRRLPGVAKDHYIFECLIDELQSTNSLEGVQSTREEFVRSARAQPANNKKRMRFGSMVRSYGQLLSNELSRLETPEDIHEIFHRISSEELEEQDLPDGDLFRAGETYVLKKSGSGEAIHKGVSPESEIKSSLNTFIELLNNDEKIPPLIRIITGHYYFGYIHPFYDGNGRTSRFISSMYLNMELSQLSAISLSRGCNRDLNKYLEAFEMTNKFSSKGELNYFIDRMLDIMIKEQEKMIGELTEKLELLNFYKEKISKDGYEQGSMKHELMFILSQHYLFSNSKEGLKVKELATICHQSEYTIRKNLHALLSDDVIIRKGKKPVYYSLNEHYLGD